MERVISTAWKAKQQYVPPVIEVVWIQLEDHIAAGSARVSPVSTENAVQQEWEVGEDVHRELIW